MRVIIDSSIICSDFQLRGTQFQVLQRSAAKVGIAVIIPRVAVDEVVAKQSERLKALEESWTKLTREATRLMGAPYVTLDEPWDSAHESYADYLAQTFKIYGWKVADYPNIPHSEVLSAVRVPVRRAVTA